MRLLSVAVASLALCLSSRSLPGLSLAARAAPAAKPSAAVSAEETRGRALVADLAAGRFAEARRDFSPQMLSGLSEARLAEVWKGLVAQSGELQGIDGATASDMPPFRGVVLRARFGKSPWKVSVFYDDAGHTAGLFFQPDTEALAAAWTPPPYADRTRLEERETAIEDDGWRLPATLTLPKGNGPAPAWPAVVLVHGSGPQDRDETIGANKPFRDLAWGLASRGIAVLRYEKRTRVDAARFQREGSFTVRQEAIDDALAAVALLRRTAGIDPRRIAVLGHSLGGYLVPRIGAADRGIAGFVVLAGPARPLEDLILEQMGPALSAQASPEGRQALADLKRKVAKVKDPGLSTADRPEDLLLGVPASYWLDLRGYRPAVAARDLERPLLVLQGERDIQVSMTDFALWKTALAGSPSARLKTYPALNHLFLAGEGPGNAAEYDRPGHVDAGALGDIAAFLLALPAAAGK